MKNLRMWTDVDEVLADFQTPAWQIMERVVERPLTLRHDEWDMFACLTKEELARVFEYCERPGFCSNLKPLPGAQDAVKELRKHVDLFAVTSHFHSVTWVFERDKWLQEHFGFKRNQILHTSAKFLVKADICLDDKPDHVLAWQAEHPEGLAMLWSIPNTSLLPLDKYRVKDWDDVLRRVVDFKGR